VREGGLFLFRDGGKGGFDDTETFVELLVGDQQGDEDADHVVECSGGDDDEAVLVAIFGDSFGFGVGGLARLCVAH